MTLKLDSAYHNPICRNYLRQSQALTQTHILIYIDIFTNYIHYIHYIQYIQSFVVTLLMVLKFAYVVGNSPIPMSNSEVMSAATALML